MQEIKYKKLCLRIEDTGLFYFSDNYIDFKYFYSNESKTLTKLNNANLDEIKNVIAQLLLKNKIKEIKINNIVHYYDAEIEEHLINLIILES